MVIDGGGGYVADGKDIEQHSNPGEGLAVAEGSCRCPTRFLM